MFAHTFFLFVFTFHVIRLCKFNWSPCLISWHQAALIIWTKREYRSHESTTDSLLTVCLGKRDDHAAGASCCNEWNCSSTRRRDVCVCVCVGWVSQRGNPNTGLTRATVCSRGGKRCKSGKTWSDPLLGARRLLLNIYAPHQVKYSSSVWESLWGFQTVASPNREAINTVLALLAALIIS